jgi:hypothetical protein
MLPQRALVRPLSGLPGLGTWCRVMGSRGSTRITRALVVCGPGVPGQPRVGYPVPADAAAYGINAVSLRRHDDKASRRAG